MALNQRQRRFVAEYLIDLNATQAAIRAGYSEKTARSVGSENLTKPDIAAAISAGVRKQSERADISAQDVLNGLYREATREGEGSSHGARVSAWGLLGKYHKLFTDRIEADISADVTVTDARSQLESVIARQLAAKRSADGTGKLDG
jgi:phage terminase small subunit